MSDDDCVRADDWAVVAMGMRGLSSISPAKSSRPVCLVFVETRQTGLV
jgi:hypothetical protein